ncbi:MAG: hypothetical protein LBD75_00960 [Candidatus Peribacteria bacterium]|jgi:hypothetical protein|nr:hypothetical protein [Candidatus Peribacteria bacterium]
MEAVEHLFWKLSPAGGIMYEGTIEVGEGVKVGTTTVPCGASNAGMLNYDSNCMSYCNGSGWIDISCSGEGDEEGDKEGVCGSADGVPTMSYPTANHCSKGIILDVDIMASDGVYDWWCLGGIGRIILETIVHCSANKIGIVNGACGSANGSSYSSAPNSNLCSAGTASSVSGSGPWSWTCVGSGGGTNASCSANETVVVISCNTNVTCSVSDIKIGQFTIKACNVGASTSSARGCYFQRGNNYGFPSE